MDPTPLESEMAGLFLIETEAQQGWTYDELGERLAASELRFRPACRPESLWDFAANLLAALATDGDITLFDRDFSVVELAELGYREAQLAAEIASPPRHRGTTLGELFETIRSSSQSGITLFTSGSTGLPKQVRQSLRNLCRAVRLGERHAADVWGLAYNPTHIAGLQVFFQALFNLNPMVNLFALPHEVVCDRIRQYGVTHLSATPTFYRMLLPMEFPLAGVRSVTLGGERTDAALLDRLRPLFPNARFRNLYASTEAGTLLSTEGDTFAIDGGMQDRLRIRDSRLEVHVSLLGEFASAERVVGEWYATGDVVEPVAEDANRFRIISRDRDWINVGGNKVNPAEVEAALREHPGVREARVFGRPHSLLGKLVCAEVVCAPTAPTETELRRFLATRLQNFKLPRLMLFVPALETTRSGKLKRNE